MWNAAWPLTPRKVQGSEYWELGYGWWAGYLPLEVYYEIINYCPPHNMLFYYFSVTISFLLFIIFSIILIIVMAILLVTIFHIEWIVTYHSTNSYTELGMRSYLCNTVAVCVKQYMTSLFFPITVGHVTTD